MQRESSRVIYLTRHARKPYRMSPQKIKSHTKLVHFHIFAERSIKMLTLRRKSKLKQLRQACLHPNKASLGFHLCYYTQACGCINIISCKGQEVKPKVTLSSFVLLLGFLSLMAAVTRAVGDANCHERTQTFTAWNLIRSLLLPRRRGGRVMSRGTSSQESKQTTFKQIIKLAAPARC